MSRNYLCAPRLLRGTIFRSRLACFRANADLVHFFAFPPVASADFLSTQTQRRRTRLGSAGPADHLQPHHTRRQEGPGREKEKGSSSPQLDPYMPKSLFHKFSHRVILPAGQYKICRVVTIISQSHPKEKNVSLLKDPPHSFHVVFRYRPQEQ